MRREAPTTITSELVLFFITVMDSLVGIWARIESIVPAARADALLAANAAWTKADTIGTARAEHKLTSPKITSEKVGCASRWAR